MANLREFYQNSLRLAMIGLGNGDQLVTDFGDNAAEPILVEGKKVYLSGANRKCEPGQVLFHPMVEAVHGSESRLFTRIRRFYESAACMRLQILVTSLINFSVNTDDHPKSNAAQREILTQLNGFETDLGKTWTDLITKSTRSSTLRLLTSYSRNAENVGGQRWNRCNIVSFPIYEKLKGLVAGTEKSFQGISKGRAKQLIQVIEYVLPNITLQSPAENQGYSRGSSDSFGPRWNAMLRSFLAIQADINRVAQDLDNFCYEKEQLVVDIDFAQALGNTVAFQSEIRAYTPEAPDGYVEPAQAPAAAPVAAPVVRAAPAAAQPTQRPAAPVYQAPTLQAPAAPTNHRPPPVRTVPQPQMIQQQPQMVPMNVGGTMMMVPAQVQQPVQQFQPMQQAQQPQYPLVNVSGTWCYQTPNGYVVANQGQQPVQQFQQFQQAPASPSLFGNQMQQFQQVQQPAYNPLGGMSAADAGTMVANGQMQAVQQQLMRPAQAMGFQQPVMNNGYNMNMPAGFTPLQSGMLP
jgi:hypothetical protein